jgi:hypothetical protein
MGEIIYSGASEIWADLEIHVSSVSPRLVGCSMPRAGISGEGVVPQHVSRPLPRGPRV